MLADKAISFDGWSFDVTSLMVLISEADEQFYRLARRSLLEACVAAPVSGIQNYLKSYDLLLTYSPLKYYSPYGCNSAPLRNMKLDNLIAQAGLLMDNKFTVLSIPPHQSANKRRHAGVAPLWAWFAFTWAFFAAIIVGALVSRRLTWIGLLNCVGLVGWSIILRTIEHFKVQPACVPSQFISQADRHDAVYFLGRGTSCLILQGNRQDVKRWTSDGLVFKKDGPLARRLSVWQWIVRGGTLLILTTVFLTIPNGTSMDQLLFILINVLAQSNTLIGRWLNANHAIRQLDCPLTEQKDPITRTHVYAEILRQFRHIEDRSWVEKAALLPQTPVWTQWRDQILDGYDGDAKELYDNLLGGRMSHHVSLKSEVGEAKVRPAD